MAFPATYNISYYLNDTLEFNVYPKNSAGGPFTLMGDGYFAAQFFITTQRGTDVTDPSVRAGTATIEGDVVKCKIDAYTGLVAGAQYIYEIQVVRFPLPGEPENTPIVTHTLLNGTISVTDEVITTTSLLAQLNGGG